MAEHSMTYDEIETPERLLADRQRFWHGFTGATLAVVISAVVVLILMAIFLL
jgi:hypothetical protein